MEGLVECLRQQGCRESCEEGEGGGWYDAVWATEVFRNTLALYIRMDEGVSSSGITKLVNFPSSMTTCVFAK